MNQQPLKTEDTWAVLTRYKMLEDHVADLKAKALLTMPMSDDVTQSLEEAEKELAKLKAWISINYNAQKLD